MDLSVNERMRRIPSVEELLTDKAFAGLLVRYPRPYVTEGVRSLLSSKRDKIKNGIDVSCDPPDICSEVKGFLNDSYPGFMTPVINATGIILHTNLGRAPLSQEAIKSLGSLAGAYIDLEYDLKTGERGPRNHDLRRMLSELTGAEDALIVNNNAAAVLLTLVALANKKSAVISRGELVQIGGGFRVPEILEQGGVTLKEVGTTNQTYIEDYEKASDDAAILLKVNPSNYEMTGFVHTVEIKELAALARKMNIPLVYDMGSGAVTDTEKYGLKHEYTVRQAVRDGADLVCFSGDKLFGGCQAGIIVGRKDLISELYKHSFMRVIRADKVTEIILSSVVKTYLDGKEDELPVIRMMGISPKEIKARAEKVIKELSGIQLDIHLREGSSMVGGGTLPNQTLPTYLIAVRTDGSIDRFAEKLRTSDCPVIGRVEDDEFLMDLRTVLPEQDSSLSHIIWEAAQ